METINDARRVIHLRGSIPCSIDDPEGWAEYVAQKERERQANPLLNPAAKSDRMQAWIRRAWYSIAGCLLGVAIAPVATGSSVLVIAASIVWFGVCEYQLRGIRAS